MVKTREDNIMNEKMETRALMEADYFIATKGTVRTVAQRFNISKSTVHKDLAERLKDIDMQKSQIVRELLKKNKKERCIRGGLATQKKYLQMKEKK